MPRHLRNQRFTIIEMIWVIVVIAIILGMGAAAMTGLGTHKGVEGGARMTSRMVELTRQYAISENTRVALMMPMDNSNYNEYTQLLPDESSDISTVAASDPDGAALDTDQYGIVMRPAIVTGSGSSYEFVRWIDDSKWEVLPPSVYFSMDDITVPNDSIVDIRFTDTETNRVIKDATYGASTATQKGIVFKPSGSLSGVNDVNIYIKPFSITSASNDYDPGTASVYQININWLTGKITTTQWKKLGSWRTVEK